MLTMQHKLLHNIERAAGPITLLRWLNVPNRQTRKDFEIDRRGVRPNIEKAVDPVTFLHRLNVARTHSLNFSEIYRRGVADLNESYFFLHSRPEECL